MVRVDDDRSIDQVREEATRAEGDAQRSLLERALTLFRGETLARIEALWVEGEQRRLVATQVALPSVSAGSGSKPATEQARSPPSLRK